MIGIGQRLPPVIERNSKGIQFQLEIFERLIIVNHYIISVARNAQKCINFVLRLCCLLSSTPSYQIAAVVDSILTATSSRHGFINLKLCLSSSNGAVAYESAM